MLVSIVIPAYNEAERIQRALDRLRAYLATVPWDFEVIVVDDGSTDATVGIASAHPLAVRLIVCKENRGKGAAVREGAKAAQGDFILITDVDLSTPIETLDLFLQEIQDVDIVAGSRSIRGAQVVRPQAPWKVLLGRMGNVMIRALAVPTMYDTQNGFKLFRRATTAPLFQMQRNERWGFDFELLFLARKRKLRIKEIPIVWSNDDRSKVRTSDYFKTFIELITLRIDSLRGRYHM